MSLELNLPENFYCHILNKIFKTGIVGEENGKEKYESCCSLAEITILLLFIDLVLATENKKNNLSFFT